LSKARLFTRKGQESRHNMAYWRYDDYIGIGPGAHGRVTIDGQRYASRVHRAPDIWLDKVAKQGHGYHDFDPVSKTDAFTEMMMMGLRLCDGVELKKIAALSGQDWRLILAQDKIERLNSLLAYLL